MLWDDVVGHAAAKQSLLAAVEHERVNHAYIFTGPPAVGKFMVARAFAGAILCPDNGCGVCNTCRRVLEDKHPDVAVIRPAGKNIPVDTIREVRSDAFKKPAEADRKVYIFKNAEKMWEEGASTLLKVLEEPPANVVFILVTASPGAVLQTIRSRCQEVRFANVPTEELTRYLVENRSITEEKAALVSRLTGGVLGRALDWCDEPWRLERRDTVIRTARALRRSDLNRTLELAAELNKDVRSQVDGLAAFYEEKKEALADGSLDDATVSRMRKGLDEQQKREQLKQEIRGIKEVLSMLAWWYRDILIFKEGSDGELLANNDMQAEIADEADSLPVQKLLKGIELLSENMRAAEQNVPGQLNIESALLGLQEVLYA
jgi:DNA polymerase-3 subunit delta'